MARELGGVPLALESWLWGRFPMAKDLAGATTDHDRRFYYLSRV